MTPDLKWTGPVPLLGASKSPSPEEPRAVPPIKMPFDRVLLRILEQQEDKVGSVFVATTEESEKKKLVKCQVMAVGQGRITAENRERGNPWLWSGTRHAINWLLRRLAHSVLNTPFGSGAPEEVCDDGPAVQPGDEVVVPFYAGYDYTHHGQRFRIIQEKEILAITRPLDADQLLPDALDVLFFTRPEAEETEAAAA